MKLRALSTLRRHWRLAVLVLALPCLMGAEVYRWVDANGVVNYTQQPPREVESQQITTRLGAPSVVSTVPATIAPDANQQADLTIDQQAMLEDLRQAEATRQGEVAKIRTSNCGQARTMLERLQARGRVRVRDGNSERVMGEDERQQRISDAQEGVAINCGA